MSPLVLPHFTFFPHCAITRQIANVYFRDCVPLARDNLILRRSLELHRFPFPLGS